MQWSCKTTKLDITLPGLDMTGYIMECRVPTFAAIFYFVCLLCPPPIPLLIFAVSASVSSERLASSCWSALSWQTLEVSQADTNIETSPHQTKLSRGEA